jgi:hypothetical protein
LGTLSGVWLLTKPPISDFNQSEKNAPLPREPIAPRASDKDARPKKDIIGTQESSVKTLPPGANGVNNPLSLEFGVTYNITLEKNEESYFRLSSPADELKIILDMRLANNKHSNLQSTLSILDQDGGVIQNRAIVFNEIDVGYRKETSLSLKQATTLGFKLLNTSNEANFWLTIFKKPDSQLVPFFGELVPKPLGIGEGGSGRLAAGEYAYYVTSLPRGEYKVILDFVNSTRQHTNIQGYLALLDSNGGNQKNIIRLNEIDVSYRKIGELSLKKDETLIIRISNHTNEVNYTVQIAAK